MANQKLIKFSERTYYLSPTHKTDRPILGAIIGDRHVLMIDGGNSPQHVDLFLKELAQNGINMPSFVVLTHWHWDHIFGLSKLNIPIIAHRKTAEHMYYLQGLKWDDDSLETRVQEGEEISFCADMMKKEFGSNLDELEIVLPTILFDDQLTIDLGNLTCKIVHVGGDHAEDSSIIYIEEEKFMFLGDCNSCDIYSEKRKYTAENLLPLLNSLEDFPAEWYLHSHSEEPISRNTFLQENKECRSIIDSIEKYGNKLNKIINEMQSVFGRELTRDDVEFVQYFLNGSEFR